MCLLQYPHCTQKVNAICAKIGICVRIFHICTIHKIRCRCHRSRQTHTIVTYVYKYIRSLSIIEKPAKPIGSIEAIVSTSIVPTCSCRPLAQCTTVKSVTYSYPTNSAQFFIKQWSKAESFTIFENSYWVNEIQAHISKMRDKKMFVLKIV